MNRLRAISPVDGRYASLTTPLSFFFSEEALIRHRVEIEAVYFELLCGQPGLGLRRLTKKERLFLKSLKNVSPADAVRIKKIEGRVFPAYFPSL